MTAKLIALPTGNVQDIPRGLRCIADQIEKGEYGKVEALAWTIDCENGTAVGMLGGGHPSEAHLLFCVAAAEMVNAVMEAKALL